MIQLPPTPDLLNRVKSLAALDLIMAPAWEDRCYSFNSTWSETLQMACMKNGSGDEWWLVFHSDGWAALKGLDLESPAYASGRDKLSNMLHQSFPLDCEEFSQEPAFCWAATSFAALQHRLDAEWTWFRDRTPFANLDGSEAKLLEILTAPPGYYTDFASDYYETDLPAELVEHVYALEPITQDVVATLNPTTRFSEIEVELFGEIAYPRPL